jgi:hypothetical protein
VAHGVLMAARRTRNPKVTPVTRNHVALLPLVLAVLHCHASASSTETTGQRAGQAATINGASTGAFDREFTPAGYTAISAKVTVPAYTAPIDGSQGEPYVYYIVCDDLGSVAMEAGLAFQHGSGTNPPPRWRPYLRGAGPGNSNAMTFASEAYSITPGSTVTLAATFDGGAVHVKVNGDVTTSEPLQGLAPESAHMARVVSNAVSGSYGGGALAQVGPVVFSDTTVWTPGGDSASFDDVEGWSTTAGGRMYGTSQYPASMITIDRSGGVDTITLFPAANAASDPGADAGAGTTASATGNDAAAADDAAADASSARDDAAAYQDGSAAQNDAAAYEDDASADADASPQSAGPSCDQLADGTYCGDDGIDGGDPSTLYSCASGLLSIVQVCASGCRQVGIRTTPAGSLRVSAGIRGRRANDDERQHEEHRRPTSFMAPAPRKLAARRMVRAPAARRR